MSEGRNGRKDQTRRSEGEYVPSWMFPGGPRRVLPVGARRSLSDCCERSDGKLLDCRSGARVRSFSRHTGNIVADAGVTLGELLDALPPTHTLPVLPGSRDVTLGGAIANDVHGKNHHRRGSFGAWVQGLCLRRSDQRGRLHLRPTDPLFKATVGGMGMTGLIDFATVRCIRVPSRMLRQRTTRHNSLAECLEALAAGEDEHEYVLAALDTSAGDRAVGRGLVVVADHTPAEPAPSRAARARTAFAMPVKVPAALLNDVSLPLIQLARRAAIPRAGRERVGPPDRLLFPTDGSRHFGSLTGRGGPVKHQSIIPPDVAEHTIAQLLKTAQKRRRPCAFAQLARFGDNRSPALMSFARPGYALTLDFADRGEATTALLEELDVIVLGVGGAVNPYMDRRMSPTTFAASMPGWREVERLRDPSIVSDLWRRTALKLMTPKTLPNAA